MNSKFEWGGVKDPDVYLEDAVSVNNSRNMRQFHVLLASQLANKGEKAKALEILNKAVVEFPNSKMPYDRFDISLAETYHKAGDIAKAKEVLGKIISYHTEYLNYYKRFTGKKARSVEGEKQLCIYMLAELSNIASNFGMKEEVAKLQQIPEVEQMGRANQVRDYIDDYVSMLNQASSAIQQGNLKQAEEIFLALIEGIKANLMNTGSEAIDEQAGNMLAYLISTAQRAGLNSVIERVQQEPQMVALAKKSSEAIAARQ
jgi:tetratricopeptide (TPR) repeat protein